MTKEETIQRILALKKQRNAVILAHYYVADDLQKIADYTGDSFYLSQRAAECTADVIVFCGVRFMGESAKILAKEKTVYLPDLNADCPMAHMASVEGIEKMRQEVGDLAVVCYVNSTARLKSHADVCVTSSNALKIVKSLPNKNIYFIPDENLGRFIAEQCPEKNFYFSGGCCPVHAALCAEDVLAAKKAHPDCEVLVHPECKEEVVTLADFAGSTKEIIEYAVKSDKKAFIVGTEWGVLYELQRRCPDKEFFFLTKTLICPDMKMPTLDGVLAALEGEITPVVLPDEQIEGAKSSLERMLKLGK